MYVHNRLIDEEIDFHTNKNLTNLSAFGSILKNFWEPISVGVKVVFSVEDNTTLRIPIEFGNSKCTNKKIDSRTTQNLTSLSALGSKDFWEPTSVNARVVLLVEDDTTLYIPMEFGNSWGLRTY